MGCNMKEGVRNLLLQLLDENINVCCLCMKIVETRDRIRFDDEVILNFQVNRHSTLRMRDVLSYLFGEAVIDQQSSIGIICQQCSSLAASSYAFINESKQNTAYCAHIVEHLETVFDNTTQQSAEFKTLYLSFDLKPELVTYHMFDDLNVNSNVSKALQRYKKITESNSHYHHERKVGNIKQEMNKKQKTTLNKMDREKNNITKKNLITIRKEKNRQTPSVTKEYMCPECDLKFQSAPLLRKHKIQIHTNLMCSECGKQFKYPQSLKAHMSAHYSKYICQKCGRSYKTLTTMRLHYENDVCQHQTRHSPANAKFTCDYCNKKYTQKMSLRVHIQYEHLNYKSHHCKWCKKKFWCKSRLDAHSIKHTKEKMFLCVTCDRKFVSKESLLYHTRIHTGEKPYDCPNCDQKFLSISRRTAHIRIHHKDPNVQC